MPIRKSLLLLTVVLIAPTVLAQHSSVKAPHPTANVPAFEVATIKPTARTDGAWRLGPTDDGYSGTDISLLNLIREAYGIRDSKLVIGGPSWIDSERFDLEAKFNAAEIPDAKNLTYRQRADMLRSLLADRFRLRVHREAREFPVYNLVIARNGPKLQETKPEDVYQSVSGPSCLFVRSRSGYIQVQSCTPKDLEDRLRFATGRTVIDRTGLIKRYDFELLWAPENTPADSPDASAPSIFSAVLEQLCLELKPATAPIDLLVIDSAEKPSAN